MMSVDSNGGSGGYVEHVFRFAAETLLGIDLWNKPLEYIRGRNIDISEIQIENSLGQKLKFARAYGFRNIQSIMLKMRRGKCDYDFIEIMACPSGCINGGGQIKLVTTTESSDLMKLRLQKVNELLHNIVCQRPEESKLVKYLYSNELLGQPLSSKSIELLHTRYHAVPKLELIAPLAVKW